MTLDRIPICIVYEHPVFGRGVVIADEKIGVLVQGVLPWMACWSTAELIDIMVEEFRGDLAEALSGDDGSPGIDPPPPSR